MTTQQRFLVVFFPTLPPTEGTILRCAVPSRSVLSDSATPWTVPCQAPLSVGILQARILKRIAMPFSRGSSQPRDRTQVFHIAGRDLPNPGIEPRSPALRADSLPSEPPGKPFLRCTFFLIALPIRDFNTTDTLYVCVYTVCKSVLYTLKR